MGFGDKMREKQAEGADNIVAKAMDKMMEGDVYFTIVTAFWNDVPKLANAAARRGWRLHTIRDGLRGDGADMGYRLLFERDAMEAIKMTIDGMQP